MSLPKIQKTTDLTLKERVNEFWDWFSERADFFRNSIKESAFNKIESEVTEHLQRFMPGMAWVFGPGNQEGECSFTLSGEGILTKQFVSEYWLSCVPQLNQWIFFSSRQPSKNIHKFTINLGENYHFEPKELWVHPIPNAESEKIDITVWHPLFSKLNEQQKWLSLFLLLDEVIGENATQNWIGEVAFGDDHLKQSIPVWEISDFIQELQNSNHWEKSKPTDTYSGYQINIESEKKYLRSDVFVGTSRCWPLIREYHQQEGVLEHPCPGLGIDFGFLAFPSDFLPDGKEVEFRSRIEDDIEAVLERNKSGLTLGGATGREMTYIDLIFFDGARSIELVKRSLKKFELPPETSLHFFTTDKQGVVVNCR